MEILIETIKYIDEEISETKEAIESDSGNKQFDCGFNLAAMFTLRKLEKIKNQIENYIFLEQNK